MACSAADTLRNTGRQHKKARWWASWGWDGEQAAKALLDQQVRGQTVVALTTYVAWQHVLSAGSAYPTGLVNNQRMGVAYITFCRSTLSWLLSKSVLPGWYNTTGDA
jgi:hypothetical protein